MLDELLGRLTALDPKSKAEVAERVANATKGLRFIPNPGPQTQAYLSKADILLYGGQAGGGKTLLELGWGVNDAQSGIIFRRELNQTDGLEKEGKKLIGEDAGFNGQKLEWTWPSGKTLKLAGMNQAGDWVKHAGRERDFMSFDEGGEFLEMQVAQIIAWLRAAPGKRCRVIIGSNPPRSSDGLWMIKWFAPWLDARFPNPASPGELRWACGVTKGEEYEIVWVDGPGEYQIDNETYTAKSYTFIPASLTDNPYRNTPEYRSTLQSLPEPLRSQLLYGDFKAGVKDAANQVVPTAWVRAAQERWISRPPHGIPMCNIGVDCSGGGDDPFVMAPRYDGWFGQLIIVPGAEIPQDKIGTHCAGLVVSQRRDECPVTIDLGGGYGGSTYEHLKANGIKIEGHKGAAESTGRTKDKQMGFKNKRAEVIWRFREALDPEQEGGSPISLPPSQRLLADLTAPTFEHVSHKGGMAIKIETKEEVCKRLGRSTDEGDAVVMSWSNGGRALYTQKDIDRHNQSRGRSSRPEVLRKTLGARR